jgi:hypothetical protein
MEGKGEGDGGEVGGEKIDGRCMVNSQQSYLPVPDPFSRHRLFLLRRIPDPDYAFHTDFKGLHFHAWRKMRS